MAAPQIPNLLSLRGRGGGRGRGRGRGAGRGGEPGTSEQETPEQARERADRIVQATDTDANLSRLSAVEAGYLHDPFARIFTTVSETPRRMPIINRGTYARTTAIDKLVTLFLQSTKGQKQIISLGAGTDTRYFRLAAAGLTDDLEYHELDFPANTATKLARMNRRAELAPFLAGASSTDELSIHSTHYHLHPIDLRQLARADQQTPFLSSETRPHSIKTDIPTLILSECCLCYLEIAQVDAVLRNLISADGNQGFLQSAVGLIFYEPIKPDDAFGRVMSQNLDKRGIQMPTLAQYPSLKAQQARFAQYGLIGGAKAVDINWVMSRWIPEEEKERIDRCEMLDEMEEWIMLAQHYCISFGWRLGASRSKFDSDGDQVWARWKELPSQEA